MDTDNGYMAPMAAQPAVPASETNVGEPVLAPAPTPAYTSLQPMAAQPSQPAPVAVVEPNGTVATIAGYLNVGVGLIVLAAIGMYIAGIGIWWAQMHVSGRDEGVEWMERAVSTLFWLVVLLGLVRFAQYHTQFVLQILAVVVILLGGWAVISVVKASGEGEDEH